MARPGPIAPAIQERVKPLELFFDLVFVFAVTQATGFMAANPTWAGLGKGLVVLAAMWWAWVGYTWLASSVDVEEGVVRIAFFAAMAAMFVMALAAADPYGDRALTFAIAYLVVRILHLLVFLFVARSDPAFLRSVLALTPSFVVGPLLLLPAAFADGWLQAALWGASLGVDYLGPLLGGSAGWVLSPGPFAERHGLIMIIALGEAIIALGVGASDNALTAGRITAAVLVIVLASALWWAYFDVVALVAERRLHALDPGVAQNSLARDSYSYLHLAMVAGVVLLALAGKKTAAAPADDLSTVGATALGGGLALYLVAHVLFRLRNVHSLNRQRLVTAALALAAIPLLDDVDALAAFATVTALACALIGYETIRYADARSSIRHVAP